MDITDGLKNDTEAGKALRQRRGKNITVIIYRQNGNIKCEEVGGPSDATPCGIVAIKKISYKDGEGL